MNKKSIYAFISYLCDKFFEDMIKRIFFIVFVLVSSLISNAQKNTHFNPPFDFPLSLSSNFGELRSNHFHGGIDIKTQGVVGKPIHCIADGYVSRVLVTPGGYGQALFITHKNGYTSVYGHVSKFAESIEKVVKEYQYKKESYSVDLIFEPNQINFKSGEIIALSGNEGYSFGPHLHFELRDDRTGKYVNPLLFYKRYFTDNRPPVASNIYVYPKKGRGIVNGTTDKKTINVSQTKQTIEAWGEVGFGIKAFDYMDGTYNHYGVYSVTLYLDSLIVFQSKIDSFYPNQNRLINAFTDYKEFKNRNNWIMLSYRLPGNSLNFIHANYNNGFININQEKRYNLKYVIEDLYGNKKKYSFMIQGKQQQIPTDPKNHKDVLYCDKGNNIQEPGLQFVTVKGMVYGDVNLNLKVTNRENSISNDYQLHDQPVALHAPCKLMIGVQNMPIKDSTKYYIARLIGSNFYSVGGKLKDGWITADILELGTYSAKIDTIAPKLSPLYQNQWASGKIQFRISDSQTGIKSYKVFINRKFEVFGYNLKRNLLFMKYPHSYLKKKDNQIDIIVEDYCNNITHKKYKF